MKARGAAAAHRQTENALAKQWSNPSLNIENILLRESCSEWYTTPAVILPVKLADATASPTIIMEEEEEEEEEWCCHRTFDRLHS